MKLVHGTSVKIAETVMHVGLLPRFEGKSQWKVSSCENAVYFSNAYSFHYAMNASNGDNEVALIEIDSDTVSSEFWVADEDALEQAYRVAKGKLFDFYQDVKLHKMGPENRTKWFSRRLIEFKDMGFDHKWSLRILGNCAYIGSIPHESITRISIIKNINDGWWLKFFDPTITIQNYRFLGKMYQATQLIFMGNLELALEISEEPSKRILTAIDKLVAPNRSVIILR